MTKNAYFAIDYYNCVVISEIIKKYDLTPMEAARRFITSKTHEMLEDAQYGLLAFPDRAVFDMWEAEQITGDPRKSKYIRGE